MADDQKDVEAPKAEAPKAEAPQQEAEAEQPRMTTQGFADRVIRRTDDATAVALRPLPVLGAILAKRGVALIDQARAGVADVTDRFLASLEGSRAKAKKE